MKHLTQTWMIAVLALTVTAAGFSQTVHKKVMKGCDVEHKMCMDPTTMLLDLNEDQQKKSETLNSALEKDLLQMNADLKLLEAELNKMIVADNPDNGGIANKVEEIGRLKTQIHKREIRTHLAMREMLTPEQKVKFDQLSGGCCGRSDKNVHIIKKQMKDGDGGCKTECIKIKKNCGKMGDDIDIDVDVEVEVEDE